MADRPAHFERSSAGGHLSLVTAAPGHSQSSQPGDEPVAVPHGIAAVTVAISDVGVKADVPLRKYCHYIILMCYDV
jgi:hypothetical protein